MTASDKRHASLPHIEEPQPESALDRGATIVYSQITSGSTVVPFVQSFTTQPFRRRPHVSQQGVVMLPLPLPDEPNPLA